MAVVGRHDDQRVGVLLLEAARNTDGVVKFDVVVNRPYPVHWVELLVYRSRLNHQEEAIRVCREGINRPSGHFWQARLVGELAKDVGVLGLFAVVPDRHVAGVEEAEEFRGGSRGASQFRARRRHGVPGSAELRDQVPVVSTRPLLRLRQEPSRTATHDHVWPMPVLEIRRGNECLF